MRLKSGRAIAFATVVLASGAHGGSAGAAEIPNPTVQGPIEGGVMGRPWNHALEPLQGAGYDYTEREYFFGGTATNLANGRTAPYTSRMLVRLPRDPKAFTGRVYVEWANVTATYDLESRWPSAGGEFHMRRGNGAVVVSAQLVGVSSGQGSLKAWDPQRYAPLLHPGDDFSFDIFAQAIEALRDPANNGAPGADPMGGLRAEKVVAAGTSQSAGRLTTFINDGYARGRIDLFALTRGGGPYEDFSTPIVNVNEENNEIPQPDNPNFVGWEEAGTAHAPQSWYDYATALSSRDLLVPSPLSYLADACQPINRGTVGYSSRAMNHWIDRYLQTGKMPPAAPRMERTAGGALVRDENGLAKGGLRHPFVQVPVAFNTGETCPLFGKHEPWSNEKIRSLYRSHCEYVTKVRAWAEHEVKQGWLLAQDRDDAVTKAIAFTEPWSGESLARCAAAHPRAASDGAPVCLRPPALTFRLSRPRGTRVVRVRAYVNGKRRLLERGRDIKRITLNGLQRDGKLTIRIVATRANGSKVVSTRRWDGCRKGK